MSTKLAWELNIWVSRQTYHVTETSAHAPQGLRPSFPTWGMDRTCTLRLTIPKTIGLCGRLLLPTEVRWLSKESCLKRFMDLHDVLSDFLSDKPEMKTVDGEAFVNYLTDTFEKTKSVE
ncbi:hypothetical protein TNCV_4405091 [Trichonephila clavipes]|uniref:Uncharacterized protein n=1 Tax=Trichonephila clavipes TaxID=2585209 RepID=A0A8X6V5R0_TRICX|nr:hypothetical protein TNCV_4405091 [Trichonephila clavipes]